MKKRDYISKSTI